MSTDKEKYRSAKREVKLRQRLYPRFVKTGRLAAAQAEYELKIMSEIADYFRAKVEAKEPKLFENE